jgi:hypothetical protein
MYQKDGENNENGIVGAAADDVLQRLTRQLHEAVQQAKHTSANRTLLRRALRKVKTLKRMDARQRQQLAQQLQQSSSSHTFSGIEAVDDILRLTLAMPDMRQEVRRHTVMSGKNTEQWGFAPAALIPLFDSMLSYDRVKYFDLLCALAFFSGKSLAELAGTGDFHAGISKRSVVCTTSKEAHLDIGTSVTETPLLCCSAEAFLRGVAKLRSMKNMEDKTTSAINQRLSKAANAAARSLIGRGRVFSDLRGAWLKVVSQDKSDVNEMSNFAEEIIADGRTLSNLTKRCQRISLLT